ncbi:type VI secretion system-associated FHA domain protein TagH, partial [Photobacterium aphoticum]
MELILSIVSYHRFTSDLEAKKSITLHDVSPVLHIGRSQACEWCLPDPERVISGQHARIEGQGNGFIITDTSTNGLFINRSVEPLGKDNHYELRDGDFISFGDYEIEVAISEIVQTQPEPAFVDNSAALQPEAVAAQATQDDWEFGFNANQLSSSQTSSTPSAQDVLQGGLFDTPMQGAESHSKSAASLFAGNLEDSFIAPERDKQSQPSLQDSDEEVFAIPENWSDNILPETARNIPPATAEPVTSAPATSQYSAEDNDEFDLAEPAPLPRATISEAPVTPQPAKRVQESVQESVQEPVQEFVQQPVPESVQKPVQESVQAPVQESVQGSVQGSAQNVVQEPLSAKEATRVSEPEPIFDPRHAPEPHTPEPSQVAPHIPSRPAVRPAPQATVAPAPQSTPVQQTV